MPNEPNSYSRPLNSVITVPDPDRTPVSSHAEQGGTLEWRTDTHNYPNFEIHFKGANPFDPDHDDLVLPGSDVNPVVIRLKTAGKHYQYAVRHISKDGKCSVDSGPFEFYVYPCRGCPPAGPTGT